MRLSDWARTRRLNSWMVLEGANNALFATNYDPYGNPRPLSGATQTAFGFTGQQTDSTGLQYLRARYYSPANGTFLTADPVLGVAGGPAQHHAPPPLRVVRCETLHIPKSSGKSDLTVTPSNAPFSFRDPSYGTARICYLIPRITLELRRKEVIYL